MKIALVAPLSEPVPPSLYGGTERVVAHVSEALVAGGHDVTLFASGDTWTSARLVAARDRAIRLDPTPPPLKSEVAANLSMLHAVRERADEFDVLHFHIDLVHFPFFEHMARRTLTTLHGRLDIKDLPDVYRRWPQFPLVSISNAQRAPMRWLNWIATVHHGIPVDRFAFSPVHSAHLAFVGRISPEKRPDRAIDIARRAGLPLKIAAKVDRVDADYYHDVVQPLLRGSHVEFIGEVGDRDKNALLGGAAALLFPIDWPEPFGLVMIEAMACGTPIIAWNRGAVPEVVEHGVTGFIVHSVDEAVDAVRRIDTLDRRRIRAEFERRFTSATMAHNYVRLYEQLAEPRRRYPAMHAPLARGPAMRGA
jgi:glycosyltransferase involved in cell wall biosynthesis